MTKKIVALLLALTMLLALTACGGQKKEEAPVEETPVTEEKPVVEEEQEIAPEEEKPAESETEKEAAPEEDAEMPAEPQPENEPEKPVEKPAEKPIQKPVQKPVEQPAQKPEASAPSTANVDLKAFYEAQVNAGRFSAMMAVEGEPLDAFYAGLSGIATKQSIVYTAMMSSVVAEIALVEVENAADVQAVKDIFQARIDYQVGDESNPGGAWYPESIEGWKNNSRVVSNGNCVMMIALDAADDVVAEFNALFA